MYLSELNILGFKSFAKKTNIVFDDGTTAIVGPNGCGKSNIVDAIRWVLGEQKSGVLRSDRMENVIFNGSRSAKPVGMAEVSLKIENTKNLLPIEYSDVVVTRRLFRSGESQYLLNGTSCRLKDILNLFMDTGMGAHAYSIIELSMVESILNGKPEERRRILEEAAGITKYKLRRNATFHKLEATEKDLIRIDDIMSEVEKSVRSLRRQVQKAQKYQRLSDRLRELEIQIANYEYSVLVNELQPLLTKIDLVTDEREERAAALAKVEAESEQARTRLIQIEQKLSATQKDLNEVNLGLKESEDQILVSQERIKSMEEAGERYRRDQDQANSKLLQLRQQLNLSEEKTASLAETLAEKETAYEEQRNQYEQEQGQFLAQREQLGKAEQQLFDLTEQLSQKRNDIERLEALAEGLEQRLQQMDSEDIQSSTRLGQLRSDIDSKQERLTQTEQELEDLERLRSEKHETYYTLHASIDSLREAELVAQNRVQALSDQAAVVKRLLETLEDYPEGVRYLAQKSDGEFSSIGPLADIIHVQPLHRRAIAAALGEAISYLVVDDVSDAIRGVDFLKQEERGVVSFMPLRQVKTGIVQHPAVNDVDAIGWANELVSCQEPHRCLVDLMLGKILVVKNFKAAQRLAPSLHAANFDVVTLDGELLSHWGLIRGGEQAGDQTEAVGRREHLSALEKKIDTLRQESQQRQVEIADKVEKLQNLSVEQEELSQTAKIKEEETSQLRIDLAQLCFEEQSLLLEKEKRAEMRQHLQSEISEREKHIQASRSTIVDMESVRHSHKNELETNRMLLRELERRVAAQSSQVHAQNLELVKLRGEHQSVTQQIQATQQQITETEQLLQTREQENQQTVEDIQSLKHSIDQRRQFMHEGVSRRDALSRDIETLQDEQYEVNTQIGQLDLKVREIRSQADKIAEELHQFEMRASELKIKTENAQLRMREEYEYEIQLLEIDQALDLQPLRKEVEETRYKLKAIGAVNLLALKEYEQEKERLDFLRTQRDDLFRAKQNLNNTIEMINDTARKKFTETFELVQENFSKVFRSFFDGGQANLIIRTGGDPLEEGIDIMATPAGKRLHSLSLMSGGEKALTAISLLFSIYLVKPSPFCIFDEVDAPLDDQNVRRFANALAEFSINTQFIIVTHNKLTMQAADQLYGITMEQEGVSKVVSVKFDRQKEQVPQNVAQSQQ